MKLEKAIEALCQGKRIKPVPSDPPINLCDHITDTLSDGYFQLCWQDVVVRLVDVFMCAANVRSVTSLDKWMESRKHSYLNFEVYGP